jgi:alkylation response protein AidB-like acyl-CoA dehydrogenase
VHIAPTAAQEQLREEAGAFLSRTLPTLDELPPGLNERFAYLREWQGRLADAGLIGLSWPSEFGGGGATVFEQIVVYEALAAAGAPEIVGIIGLDVVGPSLVHFGTNEQKTRHLPGILSGQEMWCQGFSEPDAGSDLGSLRTRAVRDGDRFVLQGQKTWTSWAQYARWCAVVARTDADAPTRDALSYLLVDMESPGIEVRPLVQVTGDPEFSEVFFDDVEVPVENVLGPVGAGWSIAMHTLSHERGPFALGRQVKLRTVLDRLVAHACATQRDGRFLIDDAEVRQSLARAHVEVEVLRHRCQQSVGRALVTGEQGFEPSVDKLFLSMAEQRVGEACLDVLGPATTTLTDGHPTEWQHTYLYGRAASVYGGTAQIQRNIVAERLLGLPRSR